VVVLQEKESSLPIALQSLSVPPDMPSFLYIANVHLDARYDQDMTRFNQIKSLLHRIEHHYSNSHHPTKMNVRKANLTTTTTITAAYDCDRLLIPSTSPVSPRIIIAGDFNMLRTNPIYTIMSTGHYEPNVTPIPKSMSMSNRNSRNVNEQIVMQELPFLPLHDVHNPQYNYQRHLPPLSIPLGDSKLLPSIKSAVTNQSAHRSSSIHSENAITTSSLVLRRTFAGGSILDYIWISATRMQAVPWMIDPISCDSSSSSRNGNAIGNTAIATTTTIDKTKSYEMQRFRWPSKDQPSDHVPIGIHFILT
jgi:hypothetical protein